ncbi:hypothetical protein VPH35_048048 [Triticum aestivum]
MAGKKGGGDADGEAAAAVDPIGVGVGAVAGLTDRQLGVVPPPARVRAEGFEVMEPPVDDEEAAAGRRADVAALLAGFAHHLRDRTAHHLGYPYNLDFDFSVMAQFQSFSINNLGDPFIESNYGVHSRQFEVAGYITNCGTEGNLHGLLVGRELFPDGIIYASCESHYSVFKAGRMYRVECVKIDALVTGEMNCADFRAKLLENLGRPAIVNVNIGTTVKGAIDDLDRIISILVECGFQNRFYIHCDGALAGLMMPFIRQAPKVTFTKPIGSVSVSGHKFMGCPVPCGVVITRLEHKGYKGIRKEVQKCLRNAHHLANRLKEMGVSASLNELSSMVVFERPQDETFVHKWQLACESSIAHVVVMPNMKEICPRGNNKKLDDFVEELVARRAWHERKVFDILCVAKDIGQENCLCSLHN